MVKTVAYEVIRELGAVELRRYPGMVIAKVEGRGDTGFNLLFRYITGNNRTREQLEMTAPVISGGSGPKARSERIAMTAPVITGGGSLAFVLPKGYTMDTAPLPLDPEVVLEEMPPRTLAVLRFSGRWTEGNFKVRARAMLEHLEEAGVKPKGEVFAMVYNPPFTPPFLRRNEVAVEVADR
jgi:hypothetical protein